MNDLTNKQESPSSTRLSREKKDEDHEDAVNSVNIVKK